MNTRLTSVSTHDSSFGKVITLGEIMLRLSPPEHRRITQATSFEACYAGGEANVAVSLANYGLDARFVSKIPDNQLGDAVVKALRAHGVGTEYLVRGGDRLGIYFVEHGASVRASLVLYDRANSAFSKAQKNEFPLEQILKGARWLHISGITPALSSHCADLTLQALKTAKQLGVTTSFDLNYRAKLWTPQQAQEACLPLMQYVDLCVGNEEDIEHVLGYHIAQNDVTSGSLNIDGYKQTFLALQKKFKFKAIATSLRQSHSASNNGWSALFYDGRDFYQSKKYELHIVDRVGAGDAFCAGLIYAMISQYSAQETVDFAVAASALKHSIHGDFNQVSISEVQRLAGGDGSGRVVR